MEKLINYFACRHFLTNFILIAVILGGVFAWQYTKKEELPDVTFNRLGISVNYSGAPAEDVEYFITKPIEEAVRGIDGVYRITSNSSSGNCNITVELENDISNIDEVVTEIRNEVLNVNLPSEVIDDPRIRVFKTSKKAILDIALIDSTTHLLDYESRKNLQKYSLALENQLINRVEVNSVNRSHYLQPEIQIKASPKKLINYEIPFNTVMQEIKTNHVRKPAGSIETDKEPKVTLISELNTKEKLENLIVQGGFEGGVIKLKDIASVNEAFEKTNSIIKVNGHEAVMLSVVKSSAFGILDSLKAVNAVIDNFKKHNLEGSSIKVVLLDDESTDLRNRLNIIAYNGAIGFILILIFLFFFLNKRSGFWVAMGIPFSMGSTMIISSYLGYTINGITLAAVIIVMGIVVDDAIVVAENISRYIQQGMEKKKAAILGTNNILLPVIASIVTTCIAFIPLLFFSGRFGAFVHYLPPIIFLMLGASLFESILILPGHMIFNIPFLTKNKERAKASKVHWFYKFEKIYGKVLEKIIAFKFIVFIIFGVLLVSAVFLVKEKMKFVMFPNEETREISITGFAPKGTQRLETAKLSKQLENLIVPYVGKEVIGFRTSIAQSRRGAAVEENSFRMNVEIVPKEDREKSSDELVEEFKKLSEKIEGFEKISFNKSRWGQSSGSQIELLVKQNNDAQRDSIVRQVFEYLENDPAIINAEIDEGFKIPEYRILLKQEKLKRLSISAQDLAATLRAALDGTVLYEFSRDDEDVYVRFTLEDAAKDNLNKILKIPVENRSNYLVPIGDLVEVKKVESSNSIFRQDLKRTTIIYADVNKETGLTPIDVSKILEAKVFPKILSKYPTTTFSFSGEIQDTLESRSDLTNAIIFSCILIYMILAILFSSFTKPLIIMLTIPFGVIGIIFAFYLHAKFLFGFFAAIGALGLAGVVINDSIIMLVKLDKEFIPTGSKIEMIKQIADISKTRLRAVVLTTITTVVGVLPTAYGLAGYDAMLSEMMLALAWGLAFGTVITLVLVPCIYTLEMQIKQIFAKT
ncbi:MAG: efflux RND transporter permease subunit [Pseudomonadota bacterium]